MKSFGRIVAVTLAGVAAATASIGTAQAAAPILIKSCTVAKPKPMSHMAGGTTIVYVNLGKKTAASVTFLVGYRNAASTTSAASRMSARSRRAPRSITRCRCTTT